MAEMKCSKCGKAKKDIRFYSLFFLYMPTVLAKPICLECSRQLSSESGKYWKNVVIFNRLRYRITVVSTLIIGLILSFVMFWGIWHNLEVTRERLIIVYILLLIGIVGIFQSLNTIIKYGF